MIWARGLEPHLLTRPQMIKGTVSISMIEGWKLSLSDLYRIEYRLLSMKVTLQDNPRQDSYAEIIKMTVQKTSRGARIDPDLINEYHKVLMRHN